MRGSPIKNFICVMALLLAMAVGVVMTTRNVEAVAPVVQPSTDTESTTTEVEVRMIFSHPPESVKIEKFGIDAKPPSNELEFTLKLPSGKFGKEIELPLDIAWTENADTVFFTKIIVRQDGKEDEVIVFTDQYFEFSDFFTIDTSKK